MLNRWVWAAASSGQIIIMSASTAAVTYAAAAMSTTPASSSSSCMPRIGFGTYLLDRSDVPRALPLALKAGYRRIDCAPVYFNEDVVGDVLADQLHPEKKQQQQQKGESMLQLQRSDLFVVSKLASPFHKRQHVQQALRKTLADLRLDYLDLYLVHWPVAFRHVDIGPYLHVRGWDGNEDIDDSNSGQNIDPDVSLVETWEGMQEMVDLGLVRHIGLSNVPIALLHELLASQPRIRPYLNQVELHPYLPQTNLVRYCQQRGIAVQAYSPLGTPGYKEQDEPTLLDEPILHTVAQRHGKTPAQVCLQWALQRNTSVVVKSTSELHLEQNMRLDFTLTDQDLQDIATLHQRNHRFFRPNEWWGPIGAVFD